MQLKIELYTAPRAKIIIIVLIRLIFNTFTDSQLHECFVLVWPDIRRSIRKRRP